MLDVWQPVSLSHNTPSCSINTPLSGSAYFPQHFSLWYRLQCTAGSCGITLRQEEVRRCQDGFLLSLINSAVSAALAWPCCSLLLPWHSPAWCCTHPLAISERTWWCQHILYDSWIQTCLTICFIWCLISTSAVFSPYDGLSLYMSKSVQYIAWCFSVNCLNKSGF